MDHLPDVVTDAVFDFLELTDIGWWYDTAKYCRGIAKSFFGSLF
jgi:hypothetical protein